MTKNERNPSDIAGLWDRGSEGWDLGSQAIGSGSAVFLGIRDQAVPFLWDQGPKFVTVFAIEDRYKKEDLRGKNMPCYHPDSPFKQKQCIGS